MRYINKLSKHDIINLIIRQDLDRLLSYDVDLYTIWDYLTYKVSFKKVDYYDFISRLILEDSTKKWYCTSGVITRKIIRIKRFDMLRLLLVHFGNFRLTVEIMGQIDSKDDVIKISEMIREINPNFCIKLISRNNKVAEYWAITEHEIALFKAIKHGMTNILKKYRGMKLPDKISLEHSNPECVKYLFKHFPVSIKDIDRENIGIKIIIDEDCQKILDIDYKKYSLFWQSVRYSRKLIRKILSKKDYQR